MSDEATDELAALERDPDLMRVQGTSVVARALAQLLAAPELLDRIAMLQGWEISFPEATLRLLREASKQPDAAARLASTVLAMRTLDADSKDELLAAAFSQLKGPLRDAAADRPGVRTLVGLAEDAGYISVPDPDPAWLWPSGKPFPDVETVAGVQARLNYLGIGAGPIDNEWNERTRNAFARFQLLSGLEPTGELDFDSIERLMLDAPDAPD